MFPLVTLDLGEVKVTLYMCQKAPAGDPPPLNSVMDDVKVQLKYTQGQLAGATSGGFILLKYHGSYSSGYSGLCPGGFVCLSGQWQPGYILGSKTCRFAFIKFVFKSFEIQNNFRQRFYPADKIISSLR